MTTDEIVEAARELAEQLAEDVSKARTREAHVLATLRANQAAALANGLVEQTN